MSSKKNRFEAGRELEEINIEDRFEDPDDFAKRDAEIRRNLQMGYQSALYVDLTRKPDNVVYEWGREIVDGKYDPDSIRERARRGWRTVPLSRHPEFHVDHAIDGGESGRNNIIRSKGNILFERDKAYHDIEVERCRRETLEQLSTIDMRDPDGHRSPLSLGLRKNETSFSRGREGLSFG